MAFDIQVQHCKSLNLESLSDGASDSVSPGPEMRLHGHAFSGRWHPRLRAPGRRSNSRPSPLLLLPSNHALVPLPVPAEAPRRRSALRRRRRSSLRCHRCLLDAFGSLTIRGTAGRLVVGICLLLSGLQLFGTVALLVLGWWLEEDAGVEPQGIHGRQNVVSFHVSGETRSRAR